MEISSLLRQIMHTAMHIGIHVEILVAHRIEHTERFLRRCRIVEIYQWFVIDLARQNGEIFPNLIKIVHLDFSVYL